MCSSCSLLFVAYADSAGPGNSSLEIVLLGAFIVGVVAVAAMVLVIMSRKRRHPSAEAVLSLALLWAIIASASLIYTVNVQMKWSNEYSLQLQTGYLDPQQAQDRPALPWAIWSALAMGYAGVLLWSFRGRADKNGSK